MQIQQIRNATVFLHYGGKKFLIDPVLAPKGAYPPFPNSLRQDQNNPLVELPVPVEDLLKADAYIVTHLHADHFDEMANSLIPKSSPLFVQNQEDRDILFKQGFTNLIILEEDTHFYGIRLAKTPGQHGTGKILLGAGNACGVIFQHPTEKILYIAGDTVWYEGIKQTVRRYQPKVIIVNSGANQFLDSEPLIMGKQDVYELHKAAPDAKIIASHMEAVNHWMLSRRDLACFAEEMHFSDQIWIPEDGESCCL